MALWLFLGALNALIAVAAGAFAHHRLAADPGAQAMMQTGVDYQIWHGLALLAVAWLATSPGRQRRWGAMIAGVAFTAGIVLFSGSLYAFALTGLLPVEGAAPVGGFLLLAGWLALMVTACLPSRQVAG